MTQTLVINSPSSRVLAHQLIDAAPINAVVKVSKAKRSIPQNDKMWAMLSDISRAKPEGREHPPEVWKALFMQACNYEIRFVMGLQGEPFPVGFRSSRLNKDQMADLITFIAEYGDRHGVRWSDGEGA